MKSELSPASKELQGADTALCRTALTAKNLAEKNGTLYVVVESNTKNQSQQHAAVENKQ